MSRDLKQLTQAALAAEEAYQLLIQERYSTSDAARHRQIIKPFGLEWQADDLRQQTQRALQDAILEATGLPAYAFKDLI